VTVIDFLGNIDSQYDRDHDPSELGSKYGLRLSGRRTCYAMNGNNGSRIFYQNVARQ